jgi:hypothetical protein
MAAWVGSSAPSSRCAIGWARSCRAWPDQQLSPSRADKRYCRTGLSPQALEHDRKRRTSDYSLTSDSLCDFIRRSSAASTLRQWERPGSARALPIATQRKLIMVVGWAPGVAA